ncbi:GNAT family N-acetyltransferase [uncultured Victivallis sp.]|uniref:GNAT family N-acetyltransferase n=1 Tax=uncultured Victivallis sp. TaxID=354118 RepID=UPI0025E88A8A|nr:GNAT family N-acetyltransferase [uncultured Victivallis sp.]
MAGEPRLRIYRPGDAPGICRVALACFEDSIRPCYEPDGCQAFLAYILPEAIAARQSDGCSTIVAEWEHEVIGVLELRDFSHISMFFVEPEFQCGGIGRRLLTRAVTLCGKAQPDLTELTVFAAPRAVEAYRHLGFSADGPERVESGVRFTPMRVKLR